MKIYVVSIGISMTVLLTLKIPSCLYMKICKNMCSMLSPRVTSYAELGGSWNSEVNNGIHARQGTV